MTDWEDRPSVSEGQVAAFRLRRHHLDHRAPKAQLPQVVGDTRGIQAQVTSMAQLALAIRLRRLTIGDVDRALDRDRTIVKTWSMRGTLHWHPSNEVRMILGGLMPTRLALEQRWIRRVGLNEEETTAMILRALKDGPLTRSELVAYLGKKLGAMTKGWADGGWGVKKVGSSNTWFLVKPAFIRGLVCFGPNDGQEVSYTLVDGWLHDPPSTPAEPEAEDAFVRGYLRSFGPADVHDLRAWSGVYMRPIRLTLERIRDELVEVVMNGRRGFLLRRDLADLEKGGPRGIVRLLPSFDAFLLGHRERAHLVDRAHYKDVYKEQGWLAPVVLRDGRVAGTWSYQRKPRSLRVAVRMFSPFDKETRERVVEEAHDIARFFENPEIDVSFQSRP